MDRVFLHLVPGIHEAAPQLRELLSGQPTVVSYGYATGR